MKNILIGVGIVMATVALGLFIAHEIVDYMQYQQVLRVKEALIAL